MIKYTGNDNHLGNAQVIIITGKQTNNDSETTQVMIITRVLLGGSLVQLVAMVVRSTKLLYAEPN